MTEAVYERAAILRHLIALARTAETGLERAKLIDAAEAIQRLDHHKEDSKHG